MDLKLHKKQITVVKAIDKGIANSILFGGAVGGGKSFLLRAIAIIWAIRVPGINIYLFRRLVKDLKATHLQGAMSFPILLREYMEDKLVKINFSNSIIEFTNGSTISLCHLQYDHDVNNYLSREMNIGLWDEATTFTPKMIKFMNSRLRLGSLDIPDEFKGCLPFQLYATNPGGPAHHYFKSGWVDAADPMESFVSPVEDGSMTRMFIPSFLSDNPSLTVNDPNYATRLLGMGDPEKVKRYLKGDWSAVEGLALPMLNRKRHMIPERRLPIGWKKHVGYDYGYSAPYSVLFYAVASGESDDDKFNPPKGTIVFIGEIYGDDGREGGLKEDVKVTARKILRFQNERNWHVLPGPADKSIFSSERGPSISEIFAGVGVIFKPSDKSPGSRVNGLSQIRTRLHAANDDGPMEAPGILIMDSCPRLFQHLSALVTDEKNDEDVDTSSQPDHDYDVVRYIALDKSMEIITIGYEGT